MDSTSLEQQLFDWDGWDQADTAAFMFYNVKLKVDIGDFQSGTKFEWVLFDIENSELTLGDVVNGKSVEYKFDLEVKVKA